MLMEMSFFEPFFSSVSSSLISDAKTTFSYRKKNEKCHIKFAIQPKITSSLWQSGAIFIRKLFACTIEYSKLVISFNNVVQLSRELPESFIIYGKKIKFLANLPLAFGLFQPSRDNLQQSCNTLARFSCQFGMALAKLAPSSRTRKMTA